MEFHEVLDTFLVPTEFWDTQDKFQAWMMSSDWKNNDWRDEEDHKFTYDCLIDRIWWEKVEMVLKTVTPLYSMLRFADQQKNGTISGFLPKMLSAQAEIFAKLKHDKNVKRDFMKKVNEIIKKRTQYLLSDTLMVAGAALDPKALYTSKLATHHSAILAVTLAIKKLAHSPIEASIAIDQFTRTFSKKEKLFGSLEARSSALRADANPNPYSMMMDVVLFDENNPILDWFNNSRSESRPILDEYDDDNDDWDAPSSFLIEELQMSKSDVTAFKRNLGFGKNSIGKKPMSQLDEEEEFEDDYELDSPHGSPLYDEPCDICSDDEGGCSGNRGAPLVPDVEEKWPPEHGTLLDRMITFVGDSDFGKNELIFKCFC
ncbi:hypothetical protein ZEAMMB73_Zm00001d020491 [Zea mays]|uniref:HAT C-terminal dimerisation domain-containing protein n=1 Tax=Zea mays TaxID=4577 RepID=A0A1D6I4D9_MAIZE|nr:hypothetical protein ZEAMMB73_Zm00001d020491 [Zea mays]ONM55004.1 hypothetical protein ZEAMMB73_Zm00001d020491 [Zea mays]ONM55005.1 hypothetical protein ZEAMMB73_Zm00001d020491 [Zea mays]ONM55006.1 hypothetical protein ZEAMMB73_Zm00001d020491 [Zea mays]